MRGNEKEELRRRLDETQRQLKQLQRQYHEQAGRDPATGLLEIGPFMTALGNELDRASRYGRPVVVARLDLDGFEALNVQHGRLVCDRVIAAAGAAIKTQTRAQDTVCRAGGDQFAILLPETDAAGGMQCLERVLGVLGRLRVDGVEGLRASAGVAPFERGQTAERLYAAAGAALHHAREEGGARAELA